ncbi:MAG: hypothetical protein ACJ74B_02975 [Gaiellaceae bacterium]
MRRALVLMTLTAALLAAATAAAGTTERQLRLDVALPHAGDQRFVDLEVRQRVRGKAFQWLSVAAVNSLQLPADIRAGAAVTKPIVRDGFATMHVLVAINNLGPPGLPTAREQPTSLDLIVTALGVKFTATTHAVSDCTPWRTLRDAYRVWYYVKFEDRPARPSEIFANSARAAGSCR